MVRKRRKSYVSALHTYVDIILECAALDGIEEDTDSSRFCLPTVTSSNWEHQAISPEIEDESLLDGEVGKRLNQLAAIPVSFTCCSTLVTDYGETSL